MPESPLELLRNGQVANLPWMTGLTSEEGSFNRYIIQIMYPMMVICNPKTSQPLNIATVRKSVE